MYIRHLIGGRAHDSPEQFETLNPATQAVLAEVARGGEAEVEAAVAAAKAAFPEWAALPAGERARLMHRLGELITANLAELATTESADTGVPIAQTARQQAPQAAENFHFFAEMCVRAGGHACPTPTHLNYTLMQPVGVCALVGPWRLPLATAAAKVAPCLAYGNTAVLKASELAPLTAARLGELALEAGVPPGVLNVVHGYGKEAGEPLVCHRDVRAVSFTGSTLTGQRIVQAAGPKKFGLELGGKGAFVVFDDAELERAMDAAVYMAFSANGGERSAGSRILVQRAVYTAFADELAERASRIEVGDPMLDATVVGPLISRSHLAKVRNCIAMGIDEGAALLTGGLEPPRVPLGFASGNFVAPTVFADVDIAMRIAQDEILGPLACLIPFDGEDDAVRLANEGAHGLAACLFTENIGRAHRVAAAIDAGMCFVNSQQVRDLRQPLGGTRAGGIGRAGCSGCHELFLEPRSVCVSLGAHAIPRWGS